MENKYFLIREKGENITVHNKYGGVVIVPVTSSGEILMIEIERELSGGISLEFPRGFRESGESSLESAVRELREELGIDPEGRGKHIGYFYPDNGFMDTRIEIFTFLVDSSMGKPQHEEGIRKIVSFSMEIMEEKIVSNMITDGMTLAAYGLFRLTDHKMD